MNVQILKKLVLKKHCYDGALITLCGIDGSGKSSFVKAIRSHVETWGVNVIETFTPTERVRKNPVFREMLTPAWEQGLTNVSMLGISLSIIGDLVQHSLDTIEKHLSQGDIVICDRYMYTNQAEILARSETDEAMNVVNYMSGHIIEPDLAIHLSVSPEVARNRVLSRNDPNDIPSGEKFLQKQYSAYQKISKINELITVNTEGDVDDNFAIVKPYFDKLHQRLNK